MARDVLKYANVSLARVSMPLAVQKKTFAKLALTVIISTRIRSVRRHLLSAAVRMVREFCRQTVRNMVVISVGLVMKITSYTLMTATMVSDQRQDGQLTIMIIRNITHTSFRTITQMYRNLPLF